MTKNVNAKSHIIQKTENVISVKPTAAATYMITGIIPSKKNSRNQIEIFDKLRNRKRTINIPSNKYLFWNKNAMNQLLLQHATNIKPNKIKITIFFPDLRRADLTNKAESIMDLLVDANVLTDDNWQVTGPIELIPEHRKGNGGAMVEIF